MFSERYERINLKLSHKTLWCLLIFLAAISGIGFSLIGKINWNLESRLLFVIQLLLIFCTFLVSNLIAYTAFVLGQPEKYLIINLRDDGNVVKYYDGVGNYEDVRLIEIVNDYMIICTDKAGIKIKPPFFINKAKIAFIINNILSFSTGK